MITLDPYSHVLPEHDQAADFIGRSLDEASTDGSPGFCHQSVTTAVVSGV